MNIDFATICGQSFGIEEIYFDESTELDFLNLKFFECYGYIPKWTLKKINLNEITHEESLYILANSALAGIERAKNSEVLPKLIAGYSVGFLLGLIYSGFSSAEKILEFIFLRGKIMQEHSRSINGGMAGITGLSIELIQEIIENNFKDKVYVSNINGNRNISVSGYAEILSELEQFLKKNLEGQCRYIKLPMMGAWHCKLMEPLNNRILEVAFQLFKDAQNPCIPVLATHSGKILLTKEEILGALIPNMNEGVNWPLMIAKATENRQKNYSIANEITSFPFLKRITSFLNPSIKFLD